MNYYNSEQVNIIRLGFEKLLNEKKIQSMDRYLSDFDYFVTRFIIGKVIEGDFDSFFSEHTIKSFLNYRSASTARATITNLIEYFFTNHSITLEQYFGYKGKIKYDKLSQKEDFSFLTKTQINNIFSSNIEFRFEKRDFEIKHIAPFVWSLCYFFGFEQKHLIELKLYDVMNNQIKNVRYYDDYLVKKWIPMNDITCNYYNNYMEYRKTQSLKTDNLLVYRNSNLTNDAINKMFSILNNRRDNRQRIGTQVNAQKLNRSMALNFLLDSPKNNDITLYLIHLFGMKKSTQLDNALREYFIIENAKEK